jgi:hypothetical protein
MISVGKNCKLNLKKLIATRLLINANSGAGKSWAIRRILEQSHGQVQQILIDLEGEFSTLREKFDYLLVGKDGEIPANIRTAEILAKKLLELNVSTIIDLSELKHAERITFVKRFLDAMINSPKELWHPVLCVVDEAHIFCPESGKSESASAVIDLATRGRKRGFCAILATQRISKLSKDAVAELNNYAMGRTGLDIDMKRASEILGFTTKEATRSLRDLEAGEFLCFGSAFEHNGLLKTKVGDVQTTHPDRTRGVQIKKASKTPENIKKLLKNVIDLPKEAEREFKNAEDMKKEIRDLRTKLTIAEKAKPEAKIDEKAIERAKIDGRKEAERVYDNEYENISKQYDNMSKSLHFVEKKIENIIEEAKKLIPITQHIGLQIVKPELPDIREKQKFRPIHTPTPVIINSNEYHQRNIDDSQDKLKDGALRILKAVAMFKTISRTRATIDILDIPHTTEDEWLYQRNQQDAKNN